VVVHALLLRALARLEARHRRHEELRRAVAVALDLLQRCLQQTVRHLVSGVVKTRIWTRALVYFSGPWENLFRLWQRST